MNAKTFRVLELDKILDMLKDEATSELGKNLIEDLSPSIHIEEVRTLQKETTEGQSILIHVGSLRMGKIVDLTTHLKIAEIGASLSPGQLMEVSDTLRTARTVKSQINKSEGDNKSYPLLSQYANHITPFRDIEDVVNNAIIGENEISDNASIALRSIRRSIEGKNRAIRNKLESIIKSDSNKNYLQDALVTIREDRFVVPVKSEHKSNVKGLVHDQSASGATYYIEPFAVVELNNELRELKIDEKKEVVRILKEITEMVGEHVDEMKLNQLNLAHLDFVFAKAKLSLKMKAFEPRLNDTGYVYIKKGRHPLLDPKEVVPTEIWLGKDFKTLLITGPNTGGKTVTIKTVGLLTLMTQCGLHIPTNDGSEISVFEKVFADIGDEQSIEQSLSTFSSHMTNIVEIMNNVNKRSLVLFDELGAGTDPTEGAALAKSILSKLFRWEVITVATTHYSELKEFALVTEGIENACVEFNVETLSPTYKLLIGVPGKSNAFEISRKLGLSDEIIDSAKEFIHSNDIEFEDLLSSIEENRKTSEMERDEAIRMRLEVEKLKAKLKDKEDKISERRDKLLNEARKEAQKMLSGAQEEADTLVKEIREIGKVVTKEKNKRLEEIRRDLKDQKEGLNIPEPKEQISYGVDPKLIRLGQSVRVAGFDQTGVVATLPNTKGDLQVQLGIMKVKANVKNLKLMDDEVLEKKTKIIQREVNDRSAGVSTEIDIRGVNVDEAVSTLDKYFDDAIMGNLKMVRVIHGKGTGALKAGLKPFFRNHPAVKTFKDGEYNEGGSGVSIIELK